MKNNDRFYKPNTNHNHKLFNEDRWQIKNAFTKILHCFDNCMAQWVTLVLLNTYTKQHFFPYSAGAGRELK